MQSVILASIGPRAGVVLLALLASGCLAQTPAADRVSDLGPTATAERMPSAPDPVHSDPNEARTLFPFQFEMNNCVNARLFTPLAKANAQELLPPGYRAANASDFTRVVHHVALQSFNVTGKTMVAYDFVKCLDHDAGERQFSGWSVVAIQIEPPVFRTDSPPNDRDLNFYFKAAHVEDEALLLAFRDAGYGEDVRRVSISSTLDLLTPTLGMNGHGSVSNESGIVAEFAYLEVGAPQSYSYTGRFWHSNATDTSYLEWASRDEEYAGRVLSCTNADDSAHRTVSGIEVCNDNTAAIALTGMNSFTGFALKTLPGLVPVRKP